MQHTHSQSHFWDSLNVFSYMLGQKAWKNLWSWAVKSAMHPSKLQSRQVNKRKLKRGRGWGGEERSHMYESLDCEGCSLWRRSNLGKAETLMWEGNNLLKVTPNTMSGTYGRNITVRACTRRGTFSHVYTVHLDLLALLNREVKSMPEESPSTARETEQKKNSAGWAVCLQLLSSSPCWLGVTALDTSLSISG